MRPLRIELEGFSAFREPTVVDLTGADLFAFVGPTGAGKSSVIDGMIFALYGSVPRYGREGLVHPAISQGRPEARVRLDFEVHGARHTAVRVVRRTKTGASTKEARLERGDEVLAADAPAVTAAVTELLGLDLEQFTKCVVLPQGAFAALLHDTTSKRQDLLVKLLDLGVYEQVAQAARRRAQAAEQRVAVIDEALAGLAGATPEALDDAGARAAAVAAVVELIDRAVPELDALADKLRASDAESARAADDLDRLAAVRIPDGVADIAERRARADAALADAARAEEEAVAALAAARQRRAELGDAGRLHALADAHRAVADLERRVAVGTDLVAEQERALEPLGQIVAAAVEAAAAAAGALAAARLDHAAADLARHLHVGDDCPVCGHTVEALPVSDVGELEAAERAAHQAEAARAAADSTWREADAALTGLRAKLDERTTALAEARAAVASAPAPGEIERLLAAVEQSDAAAATAERVDADARAAAAAARRHLEVVVATEAEARASFDRTRDTVADLRPPSATGDLPADWSALVTWAAEARADAERRQAAVEDERRSLRAQQRSVEADLASAAAAAGVTPSSGPSGAGPLRDACVRSLADLEAAVARLRTDHERASTLAAEREDALARRAVHEALASELGPKRFEAWLLEEALVALVDGASERLEQLSSGRYAMALDDKEQFEVVDHANAGERRLARTLSGGETFLASLALALALAERVSDLAGGGRAELDAIFLDEGFGTLDPEALDVVAGAIEELGASGRMVGIVSHVQELAERVPVRFEVRRGPESSTVVRVDT